MPEENRGRASRRGFGGSSLDHTDMLPRSIAAVNPSSQTHVVDCRNGACSSSVSPQSSHHEGEAKIDKDYIERTKSLRHDDVLLISTIKPHGAIGSHTLARWIKTVLQLAGLDIDMFKPHSTRHAASTAACQASVSLDEVL
ncbi:uncharacterized protein LOC114963188 [Acropora millepora]|uniref:uncharacterized protein LOC114963188 n=1 Tax=Acropora millepora TaxID=45264 RepID=UPI001CF347CF|nr:uncharacterized protein LOC114963188 [Acropora millepora]